MFHYDSIHTDDVVLGLLNRYAHTKRAISVNFRSLIKCLPTTERATHLVHPYPAKLLAHIPFFFLSNRVFSRPGDLVVDPFCGSGTVLLEAKLAGRLAAGADTNPLARLISRVKTTTLSIQGLRRSADLLTQRIPSKASISPPDVVNLGHWFYPHVTQQLLCILEAVASTKRVEYREFFEVCLSNCVRRVSLADPRLSVPVRLRQGQYPKGHWLREKTDQHMRSLRHVDVRNVFDAVLDANLARMTTLSALANHSDSTPPIAHDARHLCVSGRRMRANSAAVVITSPPYPGAQKYIRASSLGLGWLGLCRSDELISYKKRTIGREEMSKEERSLTVSTGIPKADRLIMRLAEANPTRAAIASSYLHEMRECLVEAYRVLTDDGHLVLVAATNQLANLSFPAHAFLEEMASSIGFNVRLRLVDHIRSRGLMTRRNTTAGVISREWVIVLQKR